MLYDFNEITFRVFKEQKCKLRVYNQTDFQV